MYLNLICFLSGERLNFVKDFLYLGHNISSGLSDDQDIKRIIRNLYATGNMLIRKFHCCNENIRISLFKTYCYNLYCSALWSNYKASTWGKVKVCHNDIFRGLLNVPRSHSASTLFVSKRTHNFDVLIRKNVFNFKMRFESSANRLCRAICQSEARVHSALWKKFSIVLRGGEEQLLW